MQNIGPKIGIGVTSILLLFMLYQWYLESLLESCGIMLCLLTYNNLVYEIGFVLSAVFTLVLAIVLIASILSVRRVEERVPEVIQNKDDTNTNAVDHAERGVEPTHVKSAAKIRINYSIVKGVIIGIVGVASYFVILYMLTSTGSMYVMANDAMAPSIQHNDLIIVEKTAFKTINIGDVIVFTRPPDDGVIVSRVAKITSEEPRILETEGDVKPAKTRSIGEANYLGKVHSVIPQVGIIISPPIIIAIAVAIFAVPIVIMKRRPKSSFDKDHQPPTFRVNSHYIHTKLMGEKWFVIWSLRISL